MTAVLDVPLKQTRSLFCVLKHYLAFRPTAEADLLHVH